MFCFFHLPDKKRFGDLQKTAKLGCINIFYLPWDDHQVIYSIIVYQQPVVPVVDTSAGRVFDHPAQRNITSRKLILFRNYLHV